MLLPCALLVVVNALLVQASRGPSEPTVASRGPSEPPVASRDSVGHIREPCKMAERIDVTHEVVTCGAQ